jgi:putative membrane protein
VGELVPLALPIGLGVLYATWRTRTTARQHAVFGAGLAVLALAVGPPLDIVADRSLTAHMTQHVLLLTVVPPLLVAGFPVAARATWRAACAAVALQTIVMWCWHVPSAYGAASGSSPLHALEHLSFLAVGLAFWAAALAPGIGVGVPLLLFVAALPGTGLGVALTFASSPWYAAYPDLGSQQLAGVVMWAGAGTVYLAGAAVLTVRALRREDVVGAMA